MSALSSATSSSLLLADDSRGALYDGASSWRSLALPSSMVHKEGTFRNTRGQSLAYLALFSSQTSNQDSGDEDSHSIENEASQRRPSVRSAVVFLHGALEHSHRHLELFEQLCEGGFSVLIYDFVSHGLSESCEHNCRGHAQRFHYFVDDTNDFVAFAKRSILSQMLQLNAIADQDSVIPPLIISGMSFNSLVAIHTVLSGQHKFAAMTLASSMFFFEWMPILRFQLLFLSPAAVLAPKIMVPMPKRHEHLCRDHAYVNDLMGDKLVVKGTMTVRMSDETVKACATLQNDHRIVGDLTSDFAQMPLLIMMGSTDQLASVTQTIEFFERMQSRGKEFKIFNGLFHVLYDDPEKDEVFRHLLRWFKERFPAPPVDGEKSSKVGIWCNLPATRDYSGFPSTLSTVFSVNNTNLCTMN